MLKLTLIAGPCVIESEELVTRVAETLSKLTGRLGLPFYFKASYDKANRTSADSFRGPGLEAGLEILRLVKARTGVRLTTDVHDLSQIDRAAAVVDMLQVPAFLCRQTDLLVAAARTGLPVNVKKGQFIGPDEAAGIVQKLRGAESGEIWLTERGTTFGYGDLVVDFRNLARMRELGVKVCFDASHSVQRPGGEGARSGGDREFIPVLCRAAAAAGIDGLFIETHPQPENALSDGPIAWPLARMEELLREVLAVREAQD